MTSRSNIPAWIAIAAATVAAFGCGGGEPAADPSATPTVSVTPNAGEGGPTPGAAIDPAALANIQLPDGMSLAADAGVQMTPQVDTDGKLLQDAALAVKTSSRMDPFALLQNEIRYEKDQTVARIVGDAPLFNQYFEIPKPVEEQGEITEPAPPNLRLAGIIMGDGVSALLDFNGQIIEIRPGTRIPNSEWVVVSIDTERAVLRRSGNKRPKELVVYLSGRLGGGNQGGGNSGGPNGPGDDGGGAPGSPGRGGRGGDGRSSAAGE